MIFPKSISEYTLRDHTFNDRTGDELCVLFIYLFMVFVMMLSASQTV
jgi:hypothetical protein